MLLTKYSKYFADLYKTSWKNFYSKLMRNPHLVPVFWLFNPSSLPDYDFCRLLNHTKLNFCENGQNTHFWTIDTPFFPNFFLNMTSYWTDPSYYILSYKNSWTFNECFFLENGNISYLLPLTPRLRFSFHMQIMPAILFYHHAKKF